MLCEILTETYQRRNLPVNLPPAETVWCVPTLSAIEQFYERGWRSLLSGHVRTARKYARHLLIRRPSVANPGGSCTVHSADIELEPAPD